MNHLMVRHNYRYCHDEDLRCIGWAVNEKVAGSERAPATFYTVKTLTATIQAEIELPIRNWERRHSSVENLPPIVYAQRGGLISESLSLK